MKRLAQLSTIPVMAMLLAMAACNTQPAEPQVEGHYAYQHAFDYDLYGDHLYVSETGTMDFYPDSSALDSARQVYKAILQEGDSMTIVFNYISPSRWKLEGEDFYFTGIKDQFRMTVDSIDRGSCDSVRATQLAEKIIHVIGGSIDYEYKFHLDTLTAEQLRWSFTYRDGHSDTWEFNRCD